MGKLSSLEMKEGCLSVMEINPELNLILRVPSSLFNVLRTQFALSPCRLKGVLLPWAVSLTDFRIFVITRLARSQMHVAKPPFPAAR